MDAGTGTLGLEFSVLGPLRVASGGRVLRLGGRHQQAVLAVLLLDADHTVSVHQVADAVWGEHPPSSYSTTIQTYVFHLREALEPGRKKGAPARVLVTDNGGYRLDTSMASVDARTFEALVAEGRAALAEQRYADCVDQLDRALALWRGDVLSGLDAVSGVAPVAARLAELRVAALEERIDARLALGEDPVVIAELDQLVATFPLRERLHAQRMLALYRCGRQADALAAYRQLHAILDRELGVAPSPAVQGLHQAILNHDPSLTASPLPEWRSGRVDDADADAVGAAADLQARARSADSDGTSTGRAARPRRPRWRWAVGCGVVVAAAAVTGMAVVVANRPATSSPSLPADSVGRVAEDGSLHDAVALGGTPTALADGAGSLWVAVAGADAVARVDPRRHTVVDQIPVGEDPTALAVTRADVWVVNSGAGTVSRINTRGVSSIRQTVRVGNQPDAIGYGRSGLWVANRADGTIQRIDPATGRAGRPIDVGAEPDGLVVTAGAVWVANGADGTVSQVDPETFTARAPVQVGAGPSGLAVAAGSVWVANLLEQSISRIDPATGRVLATIPNVGDGPASITSDGRYLWAAAAYAGFVARIDPVRPAAVQRFRVGASPVAVATHRSQVYVTTQPFASSSHRGGTLVVGSDRLPGVAVGFDPANAYVPYTLQPERMVYDGLMTFRSATGTAANTLVPDLAAGLPAISQDGKTYTFTVRTGIRYSTGAVVQAADFARGFARMFTVRAPDPALFFQKVIGAPECLAHPDTCDLRRGVVADNAHHRLTINLSAPDPDLLDELTYFVYPTPPNTSGKQLSTPLPGTGPYQIAGVHTRPNPLAGKPDTVFDTLIRNPYYRQWSFAAQPDGYPDVIRYQNMPDARVAARLVQAGRLDVSPLSGQDPHVLAAIVAGFRAQRPDQVHLQLQSQLTWESLNTRIPPFNNLLARRAMNYAVDRRHLIEIQGGPYLHAVTCQLLPRNFPSYVPYCPYTRRGADYYNGPDLAKARELVTRSGTTGEPVTVYGRIAGPADRAIFDYIAAVAHELGYRVTKKAVPATIATFYASSDPGNHLHVPGIQSWAADYPGPATFYDSLLSCGSFTPTRPGGYDFSEFCEPALDRLAAQAKAVTRFDPGQAHRDWTTLDHAITDASPIIAIDNPRAVYVTSARVGNYQSNGQGPVFDQLWVR